MAAKVTKAVGLVVGYVIGLAALGALGLGVAGGVGHMAVAVVLAMWAGWSFLFGRVTGRFEAIAVPATGWVALAAFALFGLGSPEDTPWVLVAGAILAFGTVVFVVLAGAISLGVVAARPDGQCGKAI
jgi:hypothetical protein